MARHSSGMFSPMRMLLAATLCIVITGASASPHRTLLEGESESEYGEQGGSGGSSGSSASGSTAGNTSAQRSSGSACTPSPLSNYECMQSTGVGQIDVHYNPVQSGDTEAQLAVSQPGSGWVGLGFPSSGGMMVGATAVIATSDASNGGAGIYALRGKTDSSVSEIGGGGGGNGRRLQQDYAGVASTISNVQAAKANGMSVAEFTRTIDSSFDPTTAMTYIAAAGTSSVLGYHDNGYGQFNLALTAGSSVTGSSSTGVGSYSALDRWRQAHAGLEVLGWGVLIPLGIITTGLKSCGTFWFRLHQALNLTGAVSVIAGSSIAFARLGDMLDAEGGSDHKVAGVIAFIGVLLMPIIGFVRAKKPAPGAKRTPLRLVWEILHRGSGYIFLIVALIAIFTGFEYLYEFNSVRTEVWRNAYIGVLIGLAALWCVVKLAGCLHGRHKRRKAARDGPAKGDGSGERSSNSSSAPDRAFAASYRAASEEYVRDANRNV